MTAVPEKATALWSQLKAVLPSWTHWTGPVFLSGFTAKWTTPTGTWTVKDEPFGWPKLIGPGGTWNFEKRDGEHIIGVLRALNALPAVPEDGTGDDGAPVAAPKGSSKAAENTQEPCGICSGYGCPDCREETGRG